MKKIALSGMLALTIAALVAGTALAAPLGAPGRGMEPGYSRAQISQQDLAKFRAARAKFLLETLKLRQNIAAKRVELRTLWAQPTRDQAKIKALSDQLVDLGAALAKKRNAYLAEYPGMFGPGFGRHRRGPGGAFGPRFHRGPGPNFGGCFGAGPNF